MKSEVHACRYGVRFSLRSLKCDVRHVQEPRCGCEKQNITETKRTWLWELKMTHFPKSGTDCEIEEAPVLYLLSLPRIDVLRRLASSLRGKILFIWHFHRYPSWKRRSEIASHFATLPNSNSKMTWSLLLEPTQRQTMENHGTETKTTNKTSNRKN